MPITVNGTTYPDFETAAKAHGLAKTTFIYRLYNNLDLTAPPSRYHPKQSQRYPWLVKSLPEPVQHWLLDNIPDGATASDFIRAIIIDAYNEDGAPYDD